MLRGLCIALLAANAAACAFAVLGIAVAGYRWRELFPDGWQPGGAALLVLFALLTPIGLALFALRFRGKVLAQLAVLPAALLITYGGSGCLGPVDPKHLASFF